MFGPAGSYDPDMPEASHIADAPAPPLERADIRSYWPDNVRSLASRVEVPVHYRQGELDKLWLVDQSEVDEFAACFTTSAYVDSSIVNGTGHAIDLHRASHSFQLQQLAFAKQC